MDGYITFHMTRVGTPEEINEFIPNYTYNLVGANNIKSLLIMNKIYPNRNWSNGIEDIIINVNVNWIRFRTDYPTFDGPKSIL